MFPYLVSFCNCDEPEEKATISENTFPSSDQLWGMIGTIVATMACWVVYHKLKINGNRWSALYPGQKSRVPDPHRGY